MISDDAQLASPARNASTSSRWCGMLRAGRSREIAPDTPLRCHFHNTRNTGLANALAAVLAGLRAPDANTGSVGGCPFAPAATGNIPTEDLLYLLHRSGMHTGVDVDQVVETARRTGELLGSQVPGLLSRAGVVPDTVAG